MFTAPSGPTLAYSVCQPLLSTGFKVIGVLLVSGRWSGMKLEVGVGGPGVFFFSFFVEIDREMWIYLSHLVFFISLSTSIPVSRGCSTNIPLCGCCFPSSVYRVKVSPDYSCMLNCCHVCWRWLIHRLLLAINTNYFHSVVHSWRNESPVSLRSLSHCLCCGQ